MIARLVATASFLASVIAIVKRKTAMKGRKPQNALCAGSAGDFFGWGPR
jgi:hypothetical protein